MLRLGTRVSIVDLTTVVLIITTMGFLELWHDQQHTNIDAGAETYPNSLDVSCDIKSTHAGQVIQCGLAGDNCNTNMRHNSKN